jgi:hypothetical protein
MRLSLFVFAAFYAIFLLRENIGRALWPELTDFVFLKTRAVIILSAELLELREKTFY